MKKVLLVNGSPHSHGNTFTALSEIAGELEKCGVCSEIIGIGTKPIQGCIGCASCRETGHCAFQDQPYMDIVKALETSDGIIVGTPVYFGGPNGTLCSLLDRLFYSSAGLLQYKPAASVAVCRRGGASAAFDRLNKYYTINSMPVVSSQYWNSVHGASQGEASQDLEGLQTMRTLARNMAWILNSIDGSRKPDKEERIRTNFIR